MKRRAFKLNKANSSPEMPSSASKGTCTQFHSNKLAKGISANSPAPQKSGTLFPREWIQAKIDFTKQFLQLQTFPFAIGTILSESNVMVLH